MDRLKRKIGFYFLAGMCLLISVFGISYGGGMLSTLETEMTSVEDVKAEDDDVVRAAAGTVNTATQITSATTISANATYKGSYINAAVTVNANLSVVFEDCYFDTSASVSMKGANVDFTRCIFNTNSTATSFTGTNAVTFTDVFDINSKVVTTNCATKNFYTGNSTYAPIFKDVRNFVSYNSSYAAKYWTGEWDFENIWTYVVGKDSVATSPTTLYPVTFSANKIPTGSGNRVVLYDNNSATSATSSVVVYFANSSTLQYGTYFTKAGYTNYWSNSVNGVGKTSLAINGAGDVYAIWKANTIKVTLNTQSATTNGTTSVYYKYNTNAYYSDANCSSAISSITTPTRSGYTFGGYYSSTGGGGTQYIKADGTFTNDLYKAFTSDPTLYAKWTANTITLTLNNQSATTAGTTAVYYKFNTNEYYTTNSNGTLSGKITSITKPAKTGYNFKGYFTSTNGGGTKYITDAGAFTGDPYKNVSANTTLYAYWEQKLITITLDNQSASNAGTTAVYYKFNTNTYYSNSDCASSHAITSITAPTKTGYTFGGYYTSTGGSGTQYIKADGTFANNLYASVSDSTTIYAKWSSVSYKLTYETNGGDAKTAVDKNYGAAFTST
ncbi:MAG: hypothetical protein IJ817_00745, partial [Clostridia bacterium]|nr:hypothetical protein [Clostridia bacterium]